MPKTVRLCDTCIQRTRAIVGNTTSLIYYRHHLYSDHHIILSGALKTRKPS